MVPLLNGNTMRRSLNSLALSRDDNYSYKMMLYLLEKMR